MAKNKSVYEVMGNVSDIMKEGQYEVHASANPRDNFVQGKSANTFLAESGDFRKAKVMEALAKTSISAMQSIGQIQANTERREAKLQAAADKRTREQKAIDDERERQEIDMQTLNIENVIGKSQNEWSAFQLNGELTRTAEDGIATQVKYADMTVSERDGKRNEIYAPAHAYAETAHEKVKLTWGRQFNKLEVLERDRNLPKDLERFVTSKTDEVFTVMDTRPLTEEYTQDDWNTDLNNRLLNVARNTKVEMKKFNEWATNSAIQGLNNMDPRWDEYAESQQLYNTADFKNSTQFASLQNARQGYEKNVAKMLSDAQVNAAVGQATTASYSTATSVALLSENLTPTQLAAVKQKTVKSWNEKELQSFQTGDYEAYEEIVYANIESSKASGIDIPSHKRAVENTFNSIMRGNVNDKATMQQGLSIFRMHKRQSGGHVDGLLTGKNLAIMDAFDTFAQVEGIEAAALRISINAANPVSLNSKNRVTTDAIDPKGSDDLFFTNFQNKEASSWAARYANDLIQYGGMSKSEAAAMASQEMDKRYLVVRSEGFFKDFTTRVNSKPFVDALADPTFRANHPHITDSAMYMAKLTGEYIPDFLAKLKDSMPEYEDLTLMTGNGDDNSPLYAVTDSTGQPIPFDIPLRNDEGEIVYKKNEWGNPVPVIAEYGKSILMSPDQFVEYGKTYEINKAAQAVINQPINVELQHIEDEFSAYKAGNRLLGNKGSYQKLDNPDDPIYVEHRQQLEIEKQRLLGFKQLGLSLEEGESVERKQQTMAELTRVVKDQPNSPLTLHYRKMMSRLSSEVDDIVGVKGYNELPEFAKGENLLTPRDQDKLAELRSTVKEFQGFIDRDKAGDQKNTEYFTSENKKMNSEITKILNKLYKK